MEKQMEDVLFIKMNLGEVESIERQTRMVYINVDGSGRIKTTSDGTVPVDKDGVAVLSYRYVNGKRTRVRRKVDEPRETVVAAIQKMLADFI